MGEAETAIAHMHEAQIDGAVINVSIVLPRRKFSASPPPSRRLQAHIDRYNDRGPPYPRGPPPAPPPRYRSPPRRRYSPPPPRREMRGGRDPLDTYRPRSISPSRSRSPRRSMSPPVRRRSYSRSRSFSRSPYRSPPRRGGFRRRDNPPPPRRGGHGGGATGGGGRRRSPSYDSYNSRSDRDRSLSRDRARRRY